MQLYLYYGKLSHRWCVKSESPCHRKLGPARGLSSLAFQCIISFSRTGCISGSPLEISLPVLDSGIYTKLKGFWPGNGGAYL